MEQDILAKAAKLWEEAAIKESDTQTKREYFEKAANYYISLLSIEKALSCLLNCGKILNYIDKLVESFNSHDLYIRLEKNIPSKIKALLLIRSFEEQGKPPFTETFSSLGKIANISKKENIDDYELILKSMACIADWKGKYQEIKQVNDSLIAIIKEKIQATKNADDKSKLIEAHVIHLLAKCILDKIDVTILDEIESEKDIYLGLTGNKVSRNFVRYLLPYYILSDFDILPLITILQDELDMVELAAAYQKLHESMISGDLLRAIKIFKGSIIFSFDEPGSSPGIESLDAVQSRFDNLRSFNPEYLTCQIVEARIQEKTDLALELEKLLKEALNQTNTIDAVEYLEKAVNHPLFSEVQIPYQIELLQTLCHYSFEIDDLERYEKYSTILLDEHNIRMDELLINKGGMTNEGKKESRKKTKRPRKTN